MVAWGATTCNWTEHAKKLKTRHSPGYHYLGFVPELFAHLDVQSLRKTHFWKGKFKIIQKNIKTIQNYLEKILNY